ncbi:hypothetical protein N752_22220 [Desulforamulus aquiferis]|nr:hypothetical protein N752_22220 [Desulforamulus aquiferis]
MVDENNAVAGVIGIYTDVTELRRQEERIKEQEKLAVVGQMAAGMAHEIRNPLTSVRGFAQLMSEKKNIDQTMLKEYLEIMIKDIDQADGFINHFLQLSRPKPPVKKVSLINALINDFVRIFESQAFLQGTKVNTQLEDVPPVTMDANQIKQVLLNLCQNSLQALCLGGVLTLTTTYISKEKMVRIEVIDNGPGISPVNLKRIGIPFFTTKDTGTGLGLSISYSIVDKHQGRIEVESQEGSGTRFSIYYLWTNSNKWPTPLILILKGDKGERFLVNYVWLGMIVFGIIVAGFNGQIEVVTKAALDGAQVAVKTSLSLIAIITFWLGIMKLAEAAGLVRALAYLVRPVTHFLFPSVPKDHPAMGP